MVVNSRLQRFIVVRILGTLGHHIELIVTAHWTLSHRERSWIPGPEGSADSPPLASRHAGSTRQSTLASVANANRFAIASLRDVEVRRIEEDEHVPLAASVFRTHQLAQGGPEFGPDPLELERRVAEADEVRRFDGEQVVRGLVLGSIDHDDAAAEHAQVPAPAAADEEDISIDQFDIGAEKLDDDGLRVLPEKNLVVDVGDMAVEEPVAVVPERAGHHRQPIGAHGRGDSSCCRNAGSWSGRSGGSAAIVATAKTTNAISRRAKSSLYGSSQKKCHTDIDGEVRFLHNLLS